MFLFIFLIFFISCLNFKSNAEQLHFFVLFTFFFLFMYIYYYKIINFYKKNTFFFFVLNFSQFFSKIFCCQEKLIIFVEQSIVEDFSDYLFK